MKEKDFGSSVLEIRLKGEPPFEFVGKEGKRIILEAATLVSRDDNLPFVSVLPLESQPAIADAEELVRSILCTVQHISFRFIRLGFLFGELKRSKCYRYVKEIGKQGYQSFYKFCEDFFGAPQKTVQRLVAINERFCDCGTALIDRSYERFSMRQLAEMATFERDTQLKLSPACSCRNIEKLRSYYSKLDWKVSSQTTWQEDLARCIELEEAEKKAEREASKRFKFESADETRARESGATVQKRPQNAFKRYDLFLQVVDQSVDLFQEILSKCPEFASDGEEILAFLKKKGQEIRYAKSKAIMDDFL